MTQLKMQERMNKVIIKGLRIFAHHGVMPQENTIGAYFTIDVSIETDFSYAMETDSLEGTISYADVHAVIKREMAVKSKLLEHVGSRIANAILKEFPQSKSVWLRLMKENPPMGAECDGAGIEIEAP